MKPKDCKSLKKKKKKKHLPYFLRRKKYRQTKSKRPILPGVSLLALFLKTHTYSTEEEEEQEGSKDKDKEYEQHRNRIRPCGHHFLSRWSCFPDRVRCQSRRQQRVTALSLSLLDRFQLPIYFSSINFEFFFSRTVIGIKCKDGIVMVNIITLLNFQHQGYYFFDVIYLLFCGEDFLGCREANSIEDDVAWFQQKNSCCSSPLRNGTIPFSFCSFLVWW